MARQRGRKWQADIRTTEGRLRPTFDSQVDAEMWEASARQAVSRGEPIPSSNGPSEGKTLHAFITESQGYLWGGSKAEDSSVANAFWSTKFLGEDFLLADVDENILIEYVEWLIDHRGSAGSTVNKKTVALNVVLKHAKVRKLISEVPHVKRMKEPVGRTRFLTEGEEEELLCHLNHPNYQAEFNFTKFLLYTAARGGEALRLTWADVSDVATFWDTKGGLPRSVPLAAKAMEAIEWAKSNKSNTNNYVWSMIDYKQYGIIFGRAKDAASLDESVIPYTLRHTCASRLVQRGIDITRVSKWLGHADITTTMRYAHLAPNDLKEAANVL